MPKDFNETTICIDHDTKTVQVWSCNRRVIRQLERFGYKKTDERIGGVEFRIPEAGIRFRRDRKVKGSEPRRVNPAAAAGLAKYRESRKAAKVAAELSKEE